MLSHTKKCVGRQTIISTMPSEIWTLLSVTPNMWFSFSSLLPHGGKTKKKGFPGGSVVKNLFANAGDVRDAGSIPGGGRIPGEGNGKPLQSSCLENPMDRGVWLFTIIPPSASCCIPGRRRKRAQGKMCRLSVSAPFWEISLKSHLASSTYISLAIKCVTRP